MERFAEWKLLLRDLEASRKGFIDSDIPKPVNTSEWAI